MRGLDHELKSRGIGVLPLHPGWVRTRMGGSGSSPSISPEGRVPGMLSLADRYELNLSGGFFRFDGARMPW
jgi:NAD(P)-dependent dehydrogenase (short-subunit alcohol dehydrogenase family)